MNTTIFFCQRIDPNQDASRRSLEKELGLKIKFIPLPCSGRLDVLHLLKALEAGAGKVYVVACPEGSCRYGQGNIRAKKRIAFAQERISEIGLAPDTVELVTAPTEPSTIDIIARRLLGYTIPPAGVSPTVLQHKTATVTAKQ